MRRFCAIALVALAAGCFDIEQARTEACANAVVETPGELEGFDSECSSDGDCCPGFVCNGIGQCERSECLEVSAACGRDRDCCSGQCLNHVCDQPDFCVGMNQPCEDHSDCCGALRCDDGECDEPEEPGTGVPGDACGEDPDCSTGQCADSEHAGARICEVSHYCNIAGETCTDDTDCCGALRCTSDGSCAPPTLEQSPTRACYLPGTVCREEDLCCVGEGKCGPDGICPGQG